MKVKNLPIRALYEIRALSRPVTRPDWRTCKKTEAEMVLEHTTKLRQERIEMLTWIFGDANEDNLYGCWLGVRLRKRRFWVLN